MIVVVVKPLKNLAETGDLVETGKNSSGNNFPVFAMYKT